MLTLASGVTATTALLEFVLVMKDTAGGKKERNKSEENKKKKPIEKATRNQRCERWAN